MKGPSLKKTFSSPSTRNEALTAYGLLLPTLTLLILFSVIPLISTAISSFYDSGFYQAPKYVGMGNYVKVFKDKYFFYAIEVGFKYALIVVPTGFLLSFLFAMAIKSMSKRTSSFVKISIYIPNVISGIIAAVIFSFIYAYQGGLLNHLMQLWGLPVQPWLNSMQYSLWAVAVPAIWLGFGYSTLLMLAGVLDIPQNYYEAAMIDGATAFQRTWYITIPSMRNVFLFQIVSGTIGALQEFNLPYLMTGGAPVNTTRTPVLLLYQHFTRDKTMGYTYAGAMVMAVIIGILTALFFRTISSRKAEDM